MIYSKMDNKDPGDLTLDEFAKFFEDVFMDTLYDRGKKGITHIINDFIHTYIEHFHMKGTPRTNEINTHLFDVAVETASVLRVRVLDYLERQGRDGVYTAFFTAFKEIDDGLENLFKDDPYSV